MDNPEASLQELSDLLPGVSRSGINHRLRRLQAISDDLRRQHGLPPEGDSQEGRT
jgi:DNA-binding transcriptional regulator WhiA